MTDLTKSKTIRESFISDFTTFSVLDFRLYYIFSSGDMLLLEEGDIPIPYESHPCIIRKKYL
jgi:hypothetical protein